MKMDVDKEAYLLEKLTDFNMHSEMKPPERIVKPKVIKDGPSDAVRLNEGRSGKRHENSIKEFKA